MNGTSARFRPRLEPLEERAVPALLGALWQEPQHLTLSFAPDGTDVLGHSSNLSALLGSSGDWQGAILRAFQTWAAESNINVGVVGDSGLAFGTPGLPQGDPRFGDIRVGAAPLGPGVLAVTVPPSPMGGTWIGDVFFNSDVAYGPGGPDVFSVAVHEAGHALGLDHNPDPLSVMNAAYGVRTGLSASDVANIQALYGPRQPDAWEKTDGNDTLATAADINSAQVKGSTSLSLSGDVTTLQDVDFYRLHPQGTFQQLQFTLRTAGLSLLQARLTVFDASGRVVADSAAASPGDDLTVSLIGDPNQTYYVRVESASGDAFGIGGYNLAVDQLPSQPPSGGGMGGGVARGQLPSTLSPDDMSRAERLSPDRSGSSYSYSLNSQLSGPDATPVYVVQAPPGGAAATAVTVRSLDWPAWQPVVGVYDVHGNAVPFEVLVNADGTSTIQVTSPVAGENYYIALGATGDLPAGATGGFFLGATFGDPLPSLSPVASGVTAASPDEAATLTVNEDGLEHLLLTVPADDANAGAYVRVSLLDDSGNVVYRLDTTVGSVCSGDVFLKAGTYHIRVEGFGPSGDPLAGLTYSLAGLTLSDPIGPELQDPLAAPTAVPVNSGGSKTGGTTPTTTQSVELGSTPASTTSTPDFLAPADPIPAPSWTAVGSFTFSTVTTSIAPAVASSTPTLTATATFIATATGGATFTGVLPLTSAVAVPAPSGTFTVGFTTTVTTAAPTTTATATFSTSVTTAPTTPGVPVTPTDATAPVALNAPAGESVEVIEWWAGLGGEVLLPANLGVPAPLPVAGGGERQGTDPLPTAAAVGGPAVVLEWVRPAVVRWVPGDSPRSASWPVVVPGESRRADGRKQPAAPPAEGEDHPADQAGEWREPPYSADAPAPAEQGDSAPRGWLPFLPLAACVFLPRFWRRRRGASAGPALRTSDAERPESNGDRP